MKAYSGKDHYSLVRPKVSQLIEKWKIENATESWWKKSKVGYTKITAFLLDALDELILELGEYNEISGIDKKTTVLGAMKIIWIAIVKESIPIWIKPFVPIIGYIIMEIVVPYMIDWIVKKYNQGWWKKGDNKEEEANG